MLTQRFYLVTSSALTMPVGQRYQRAVTNGGYPADSYKPDIGLNQLSLCSFLPHYTDPTTLLSPGT
jgi:hypothetical protein